VCWSSNNAAGSNSAVLGSNLDKDIGYSDSRLSRLFSALPRKFRNITSITQRLHPSKSFPIHQSSYHSTLRSADIDTFVK
jgi:hypothetical protein